MQSMESIFQAHTREMKALRKSLHDSSESLRRDRSQLDHELSALKKKAALPLEPVKKPTPLALRIFSMLF